jgi:hypothetical protein
MCSRAIRLPDDKEVGGAVFDPAEHLDFKARLRVKGIVDANNIYPLFAGSM